MNQATMLKPADLYPALRVGILDDLLEKYAERVKQIDEVVGWYASQSPKVIGYFADGNTERGNTPPVPDRIFKREGAIAALNSEFWSRAINSTDVLEAMPAKRRIEWNNQIFLRQAPDFIESIVKPTLMDLINGRGRFFAERVDGIFRALSGEHVTNQPQAFGKRMIVSYVINGWGSADQFNGFVKAEKATIIRLIEAKRQAQKPVAKKRAAVRFELLDNEGGGTILGEESHTTQILVETLIEKWPGELVRASSDGVRVYP